MGWILHPWCTVTAARVLETVLQEGTILGPRVINDPNSGTSSIACSLGDYNRLKSGDDTFPFGNPGIYVLSLGPNAVGVERLYVGKSTRQLRDRIRGEVKGDEVRQVYAFGGDHVGGAHVQYLESELIRRGKSAKTHDLSKNTQVPKLPTLAAAQVTIARKFLDDAILYFGSMGLRAFETEPSGDWMTPELSMAWTVKSSPVLVRARGRMEKDGGMWVFKGATMVPDSLVQDYSNPAKYGYLKIVRQRLKAARVVDKQVDGSFVLNQDWRFDSASTAGSALAGQQCNGWLKWKVAGTSGKTLDRLLRSK